MTTPFTLIEGEGPVLISVPHASPSVPEDVADRLDANGALLADADWHIDTIVKGLSGPASKVFAGFHRYVIDANRDPSGASLYPGQATTELIPTTDFDGRPIWKQGAEPTIADIDERRFSYHAPYHEALAGELYRLKEAHGIAVLFDVHSIRSVVPRLFDGRLTDFNVGTDYTKTCAPAFEELATRLFRQASDTVLNGRFRGGWTVRHHGQPALGVHAVQIEMAQALYMDEAPPFGLHADGGAFVGEVLQRVVDGLTELAGRLKP
ncbi:N-formylglutamate deformylase [Acuticoccus sp. I52.16.1]|uniref:N-formylglutamate deformylase n=1 Tax=Acuticoccus sp. I52.16.1 TaxID=2928472 RepID=UPI001FD24CFB|nr:N-formylglutamate deformylase [Acuticoccus sp. I52.16.1]UOM33565.1 N-formylglutamate deformylase [Acuticoccus sp. I52.16.1]